ncbi:hypothetical protein MCEMSE6_02801 [Oxalobacteraceae bacterium]
MTTEIPKKRFVPTIEGIRELSEEDVKILRINASNKNNLEIVEFCDVVLKEKQDVKKNEPSSGIRKRSTNLSETRLLEKEVEALLEAFAKELLLEFDLSVETAAAVSKNTKGFRTQKLLSAKNKAKTWGRRKRGEVVIGTYISYRLKDMRISLSFMLEKDLPIESGTWLISGPEHLIPDYVSFISLISENSLITDKESEQGWISFNDFEKAKSDFRNLLRTVQEICGVQKT